MVSILDLLLQSCWATRFHLVIVVSIFHVCNLVVGIILYTVYVILHVGLIETFYEKRKFTVFQTYILVLAAERHDFPNIFSSSEFQAHYLKKKTQMIGVWWSPSHPSWWPYQNLQINLNSLVVPKVHFKSVSKSPSKNSSQSNPFTVSHKRHTSSHHDQLSPPVESPIDLPAAFRFCSSVAKFFFHTAARLVWILSDKLRQCSLA